MASQSEDEMMSEVSGSGAGSSATRSDSEETSYARTNYVQLEEAGVPVQVEVVVLRMSG